MISSATTATQTCTKVVRQPRFRAGISYIKLVGTPLYNIAATQTPSASTEAAPAELHISSMSSTTHHATHSARQKRQSMRVLKPCPIVLRYTTADSLFEAGGLYQASEAGRLPKEHEQAMIEQAEQLLEESAREWECFPLG